MTDVEELEDRWILEFRATQVVAVRFDRSVCFIELTNGAALYGDAAWQLRDATVEGLANAPMLSPDDIGVLEGKEVASAVAFKSGALRLVFRPGYHLVFKPSGAASITVRLPAEYEWRGQGGVGLLVKFADTPLAGQGT